MNYYIQGDAAKAEQIKAAFEKLGISRYISSYDFSRKDVLYFTYKAKGEIYMTCVLLDTGLDHIIKTHPDYQELELPIEPKFKVGDWIACDADGFVMSIRSVRDANYYFNGGGSLPFKFVDKHYHLWTIEDAKDGDVLVYPNETYQDEIFLFNLVDNNSVLYHCCFDGNIVVHSFYGFTNEDLLHVHPATKAQRDLLFAKMKEAGYEWDVDNKELKKIQPHYDIANFKPFDRVLVRQNDANVWGISLFSRCEDNEFCTCNNVWFNQCIPFNDDTKHLLGTTDMPSEEFVNW